MSATTVPEEAEASGGACSGPARPDPYRHKWIILSILLAAALAATALGALHLADQRRSRTTFCNVQLHPSPPRGRRERVYAFTDPSIERLEKVRRVLAGRGYRLVDYSYGTCPDSSPRCPEVTLEMAEVEEHTPESLARREGELCELARAYRLQSYWGTRIEATSP